MLVFQVFGEITVQELEGVCMGWAIEVAAVSEVGAVVEGGFHCILKYIAQLAPLAPFQAFWLRENT